MGSTTFDKPLDNDVDALNSNKPNITSDTWSPPSPAGMTLTNAGSNWIKIGTFVYLYCAFSCSVAIGAGGGIDITLPTAIRPGTSYQTIAYARDINSGKLLHARIYSNGLHIVNDTGSATSANDSFQCIAVYNKG